VPLYARQAPAELVAMMMDCQPRLLLTGDAALSEAIAQSWSNAPPCMLMEEVLGSASESVLPSSVAAAPISRDDADLVTIIYTSGTSGEPKGVCLNVANVTFMLSRTGERLSQLMSGSTEPDRIFHYLPLNFCASWIALLSFLSRDSTVTLSTDLNKLVDEIRLASPHYFLNVPTLLERVKRGVEAALAKRSAPIRWLFTRATLAWQKNQTRGAGFIDALWLALARRLIFGKIKERFGTHLRALICGSAPLTSETQQFFDMLKIPVLQVYGLTETTGICTMDDPLASVTPGFVGPAIPGLEMKVGEHQEILVRGPNVFPGYWNRPEETARVLQEGWFHTGDQGAINDRGNWRISGRLKNLIILNSGHNIAPEPLEEKIAARLSQSQHVVIVGNGRGYLCALISGPVERQTARAVLDVLNPELPHYRQVRNFIIVAEALTPENGLLTANGKLRRDVINAHFQTEISAMYGAAQENPKAPAVSAAGQR
jgi:long-chain acyl-CoA synthetase